MGDTDYDRCKADHPELLKMAEELLSVEMERDTLKAEVERLKADLCAEQETSHQAIMAGNEELTRANKAEANLVTAQREAFRAGVAWDYEGLNAAEIDDETDRRYPEVK